MADQKISQLDAIVEIDNAFDSLAIVDQSAAATKKVTPSQLQTALGVPLNTDELAEGTTNLYLTTERVQDIVGAEIQGSEDITATYSDALGTVTISLNTGIDAAKIADGTVSNAEFQYIGGLTSDAQTQIDSKQATLISGTNIKTINSTSLLGSGDIAISANPAGTAGQIQFSDGSAFAADSNLYWDNTNKRLGVGETTPTARVQIKGTGSTAASTAMLVQNSVGSVALEILDDSRVKLGNSADFAVYSGVGITSRFSMSVGSTSLPSATLQVKGSGATSATTSLLVQNSSGTELLKVQDDGIVLIPRITSTGYSSSFQRVAINNGTTSIFVYMGSTSNGVLSIKNAAETDFDRLQLGGTTASFPSIKRASNNIEIRNADDTFGAGLSVGGSLNASAILQADSTTKGFLPPRMTTTQKNAISSPAEGLMVMDITTHKLCVYDGTSWVDLH